MNSDLWIGEGTDTAGHRVGLQILGGVHPPEQCAPHPCVLHNPTNHHMRDWPTLWRGDTRIMERTCPHGIGHPDPDDLAHHRRTGRTTTGVHGCDGCCTPAHPMTTTPRTDTP